MKLKKTILTICAVLLIGGAYLCVKYFMEKKVREEVDREIEKLSMYADVRYEKLRLGLIERRIRIEGIQIAPRFMEDRVRVKELILDRPRPGEKASSQLEGISLELRGIWIDPSRNGSLKHLLDEIGYKEKIDLNLSCSAYYDRKNLVAAIRSFRLEAEHAGSLELRLRLENFNSDHLQDIPQNAIVLLTMVSAVYIAEAEVEYRDDSLLPKLYQIGARRTGQSVESFRRGLAEGAQAILRNQGNPRVQELSETIRDFILSPRTLHIKAKPSKPVSLLSLIWDRSPGRIVDLLGLEAKNG